jgi:glycerol kinase
VSFILDRVPGARERAGRGELAFGTIDTWLIFRLTGGRVHATEPSNASRTMLYNIREECWDETLLDALQIPAEVLPDVRDSSGSFGETEEFGGTLPIAGVAGDQQASLFGQGCFAPGSAKNTYGTGCFLLANTGAEAPHSESGLITTIAWRLDGQVAYALEGSVFVAGAAIQWLRDELGLLANAAESEMLARSVPDTGGVVLVPAFAGLGAPYWDEGARGILIGLTRGTGRAHVVRAALESLAYQSRDIVQCAEADAGERLTTLRVDGGACQNDFLMQFQSDILGIPVERPANLEVTAFGAAALAGLATGFFSDPATLVEVTREGSRRFEPQLSAPERDRLYQRWQRAVERSRGWESL